VRDETLSSNTDYMPDGGAIPQSERIYKRKVYQFNAGMQWFRTSSGGVVMVAVSGEVCMHNYKRRCQRDVWLGITIWQG
jgi:hypothetical protein